MLLWLAVLAESSFSFPEKVLQGLCTTGTCRHLIQHTDQSWHELSDLPRAACALLDARFARSTSAVEQAQRSADGSTVKLLLRLQDGLQVEAVVMTYDKGCEGARSCAWHAAATYLCLDLHMLCSSK